MTNYWVIALAAITISLNTAGCGRKSGDTAPTDQTATVQATTVQGIAAAGNPISSGTVTLSDSSTPVQVISAITTDAGEYSLDTTGLKAPFILKTTDNSNNEMFSFAGTPGTANINPLTTLAVAIAAVSAGATDNTSVTTLLSTIPATTQMQGITSTTSIAASLQPLLSSYGSATADPFTGPYLLNHRGLDDLFDKVVITISTGTVVISRKDNNTPIFTASLGDLTTGSVITNNIPAPAPSAADVVPGNAKLTLKVQGVLPQEALIKNASFSIQLPLGITVVTPQATPASLVNYMAIPVGTAAGSNMYPAPTLSAANGNILQISLSSVTGFSTGDFLTIWYIDSSSYYMNSRNPSDFTVTDAKYYSDIYKKQELQNLAIVPDSITYP